MSVPTQITIVGGGLAGLVLGIGLRQRGVPVTIWEAGRYPRHRVCGEFICGRGLDTLSGLGLRELLIESGARTAHTAAFFVGRSGSPPRPVAPPALCLSRFEMDAALAARFRELGGELREQQRWQSAEPGEGVVCASGRRLPGVDGRWRWVGLKAHFRNVSLKADLEMHAVAGGYVGLCRVEGGKVNACGLFRRQAGQPQPLAHRAEHLRGAPGTALHERLAGGALDEGSWCAVAGFSLRPARAASQPGCRVGDALTMIPPLTGNGMSMALEAAELALEPLAAYSQGRTDWSEAQRAVARLCDRAFARRLAWAKWLHVILFSPLACPLARALGCDGLWRLLFSRTR
jgi:flavin-dependent dehydrogenase